MIIAPSKINETIDWLRKVEDSLNDYYEMHREVMIGYDAEKYEQRLEYIDIVLRVMCEYAAKMDNSKAKDMIQHMNESEYNHMLQSLDAAADEAKDFYTKMTMGPEPDYMDYYAKMAGGLRQAWRIIRELKQEALSE
jgi:hypothetical protein